LDFRRLFESSFVVNLGGGIPDSIISKTMGKVANHCASIHFLKLENHYDTFRRIHNGKHFYEIDFFENGFRD